MDHLQTLASAQRLPPAPSGTHGSRRSSCSPVATGRCDYDLRFQLLALSKRHAHNTKCQCTSAGHPQVEAAECQDRLSLAHLTPKSNPSTTLTWQVAFPLRLLPPHVPSQGRIRLLRRSGSRCRPSERPRAAGENMETRITQYRHESTNPTNNRILCNVVSAIP